MAICLLMFFETLRCFFSRTKSFGSVCILYISFADQCFFLSLRSKTETKHRIKYMRVNDYNRRSEKKLISFFVNERVELAVDRRKSSSGFSQMNKENLLVGKQKRRENF